MAIKRTRKQQHNYENIPPKIWLEIRSRLPIKDVFKYRCVAKSWNPIPDFIYHKIEKQPLSGLILRDTTYVSETRSKSGITYLSKGAIESISIRTDISIDKPSTVSSGFDMGYLRDTFFEFGPLSSLRLGEFFTVDNGLILLSHCDGTYYVYNPLTKQVLDLPMPPLVVKAGITHQQEKCAFLINLCSSQYFTRVSFLVMRLIPRAQAAEVFYSEACKWFVYKLMIDVDDDNEVLNSCWCSENFVFVNKTRTLFFLTEKDQGLAVGFDEEKVEGHVRRMAHVYNLPLPEVVKGGFRKARLGGNPERLYLSYYDDDGRVWFWMRDGERLIYNDTWVPLLEIGRTPELSRSLEHIHNPLFELLKEGNSIIPIGFYPRFAIALLRLNSTIFTYNLIKKKLVKFAEISDQDFKLSTIVLPYIPLVTPFENSMKSGKLKPITVAAYLVTVNELHC